MEITLGHTYRWHATKHFYNNGTINTVKITLATQNKAD